ncbi:hypothetical protein O6H91_08G017600 [Diphasiastrum complanatum]|uniref:Uncharacterized protein n=1 Tax=Diphasiastrum complanatum TaxID=34168 RepID=A0ACC2CVN3_DIPCM|nr:hypothetical protein O6H91_08G017600 [Diphasiastrum complanatum]
MVTCDNDVFDNWMKIMEMYVAGQLPNTRGNIEPFVEKKITKGKNKIGLVKQAPGTVNLCATLFRCIEGLDPDQVRGLQAEIMAKKVLIKKGKGVEDKIDMDDACKK